VPVLEEIPECDSGSRAAVAVASGARVGSTAGAGRGADREHRERPAHGSAERSDTARGGALILAGVVLVAANLRLGVSATGALLQLLTSSLHLGTALSSFLPTAWVLAFAVGGVAGSPLARRYGIDRVVGASLVALILGTLLRGVPTAFALVTGSVIAGLGIALANVLLPAVAREYFPTRIGLVTGLYGTTLTAGAAASALASVPIAGAVGSPSRALAVWAAPALVALLVWIAARRARSARAESAARIAPALNTHVRLRALLRSRLAWAMAALFGLQAAGAYVVMGYLPSIFESAGMTAAHAAAMTSVSFFLGIPASFVVPVLGARMRDQRLLIGSLSAFFAAAFVGLAIAPGTLAWLWIILAAIGMSSFQLVLALFGLRGGTAAGTAALSTFAQSLGYLVAAAAPFAFGIAHESAGSWTIPLYATAALAVCQGLVGLYVASERRGTLRLKG
jgi:CP family cyanate transporter-like MFS transporter